jgi:hypothetical protein
VGANGYAVSASNARKLLPSSWVMIRIGHSAAQIPSCLHLVSSIVRKAILVSMCNC